MIRHRSLKLLNNRPNLMLGLVNAMFCFFSGSRLRVRQPTLGIADRAPSLGQLCLIWLLLLVAACIHAEPSLHPQLKITQLQNSGLLHVQAQQVEFSALLQHLSVTAGFSMHYQRMPTLTQVNGDCLADNLSTLFSCLLGTSVNTVIRFSDQGKPQELWLLVVDDNSATTPKVIGEFADVNVETEDDELLAQTQSENLATRLQAIAEIGATDVKDKAMAKIVLQKALNDEHPGVRAKAISSLSRISGVEETRSQLSEMLHDNDQTVRLAAVVAAYQDKEILQQAQDDANQQVRMVASVSLQKLLATETLQ